MDRPEKPTNEERCSDEFEKGFNPHTPEVGRPFLSRDETEINELKKKRTGRTAFRRFQQLRGERDTAQKSSDRGNVGPDGRRNKQTSSSLLKSPQYRITETGLQRKGKLLRGMTINGAP